MTMPNLNVKVEELFPSPTNPRKHFDDHELAELADSVRKHGILQPLLVRRSETGPATWEIVAGERRYRAARMAGVEFVPAVVRDLTDDEVIEIQLVENLQRADLSALEECDAYQILTTHGYDVARIAERTGRSPKYIYDRLRLKDLVPRARTLLNGGTIQPGHAILLSRLSPADQERVIGDAKHPLDVGGLFEAQRGLPLGDDDDEERPFKAVTVRQLQHYIDEHVRLEPAAPDLPELFPETAEAIEDTAVVLVTRSNYVVPEAKLGSKILFPRSWRRADGRPDDNDPSRWQFKGYAPATCDHSKMGFVAVGPGRGEAFLVCTAKKKCKTHWADAMKAAKAREKGRASAPAAAESTPKKKEPSAAQLRRKEAHIQAEALIPFELARLAEKATEASVFLILAAENIEAFWPDQDVLGRYGLSGTQPGGVKLLRALSGLPATAIRALAIEALALECCNDYNDGGIICAGLGVSYKKLFKEIEDRIYAELTAKAEAEKPTLAKKPRAKAKSKSKAARK